MPSEGYEDDALPTARGNGTSELSMSSSNFRAATSGLSGYPVDLPESTRVRPRIETGGGDVEKESLSSTSADRLLNV